MKLTGRQFTNGNTCKGMEFKPDAPLDIAQIEINGRYPERGWAINEVSHEVVYVQRGLGWLALRDGGEFIELTAGDGVHVPAGEQFAWWGDMTLTMACYPPFDVSQYRIEEVDDEIVKLENVAIVYLDAEDIVFLRTELEHHDDRLSYICKRLTEEGENPIMILQGFGIIEGDRE